MAIATSATTRMLTTFLLLYLCCLFTAPTTCSSPTSAGMVEGSKQGIMRNPNLPLHFKEDGYQEVKNKVKVMMKMRKVLMMMDVADYDETGPNPKHDPRKGRHP